jgi:uncharacterized protein (DUF2236 family)
VKGESHRGRPYRANAPALAAWVHNALTDSFLQAFLAYGPRRLSRADADRFVAEQTRIGRLLGVTDLPDRAEDLSSWITDHLDIGDSPALHEAVAFVRNPPLPWYVKLPYRFMVVAATATIPKKVRRILGIRRLPGARLIGRLVIGALRWALGSSPSWHVSLVRVGAPVPPGLFRQALPTEQSQLRQVALGEAS